MHFGLMVSLAIAITAVVGVFVYIPYVSDYAFWILVIALLVWELSCELNPKLWFRFWLMLSIALLVVSIVGLLTDIPIISTYAFWILAASYLVAVGSTRILKEKK